MKKINTLNEQINRMKSLMGESNLYGNLVEDKPLIVEGPGDKLSKLWKRLFGTSIPSSIKLGDYSTTQWKTHRHFLS